MTVDKPITYRVAVPPELAGERLDKAVAALVPGLSRTRVREILTRGGIWSHDQRLRTQSLAVTAGMPLIVVHPPEFRYPELTLGAGDIMWEDDFLVALRKQAGWYVQPTAWDLFGNIEHALHEFLQARGGGKPRLHLTHRLDRDTSGVLIVSKRPDINGPMQRLWSGGGVEKLYVALVKGVAPERFTADEPLGPGPNARYRVDMQKGKPAKTEFRRLAAGAAASELEARPLTGRTHQIRIHAAHAGHPLLGDARYGGPTTWDGSPVARVMLHAKRLAFRHPKNQQAIALEAEPPEDYRALRQKVLST